MTTGRSNITDNKIHFGGYAAFGLGGAGLMMMIVPTGSYLLIYMTNVAFLDVAVISAIIALSKLFHGISDLVIGDIVDRTNSNMGKARIWLLRMCIPFALSMLLLFWVPPQLPQLAKYIYVFLMYNLANTICYTFLQVPHFSLVSLMSPDRREQSMAGNVLSISRVWGALIGSALFVRLLMLFTDEAGNQNTQKAYTSSVAVYGLIMVACVMLMVFATREGVSDTGRKARPDLKETLKSFGLIIREKNWKVIIGCVMLAELAVSMFNAGASYFALYELGDMGAMSWLIPANMIPSLIMQSITPLYINKVSKRSILLTGMIFSIIGAIGIGIFAPAKIAVAVFLAVTGIVVGLYYSVIYGIVAEAVTYIKLKEGQLIAGTGNAKPGYTQGSDILPCKCFLRRSYSNGDSYETSCTA